MASAVKNLAVNIENRVALYIEGQLCAFTQVQVAMEDGVVPRLVLTVPATPSMSDLSRRARVHLIFREFHRDEWVVLFEGEILTRGFTKTPESRDLTFVVYHVSGHFEQYAITALDPSQKIDAAMRAAPEYQQASIASVKGTLIETLTPEALVPEAMSLPKNAGRTITRLNMTFPDWLDGAYVRYKKLIAASRIAESYPHKMVEAHRLFDRIITPAPDLFHWGSDTTDETGKTGGFYSKLLGSIYGFGMQAQGGRVSFLQMIQEVSASFLHNVSIVPHAESWRKTVQIKPYTYFNAIPKCNVIYSSLSGSYAFEENHATKPTRLEARFQPVQAPPGADQGAMNSYFTVFGPAELQFRWFQIQEAIGGKPAVLAIGGNIEGGAGTGTEIDMSGGGTGSKPAGTAADVKNYPTQLPKPQGAPSPVTYPKQQTRMLWRGRYGGNQPVKPRPVTDWDPLIEKYAQQHGIPSNFVRAIIEQESNGDHLAENPSGALGLGQLLDYYHWTDAELREGKWADPQTNIERCVKHIKRLTTLKHIGTNWLTVAYAYNAGEGYTSYPTTSGENQRYGPSVMQKMRRFGGDNSKSVAEGAPGFIGPVREGIAIEPAPKRSEKTSTHTTTGKVESAGNLNFQPPKDGIKFLTVEEEQRGIISAFYEIPQSLNHAIMSLVIEPAGQVTSSVSAVGDDEVAEKATQALKADDEESRNLKYLAFLCMALGDGGGIKPGQFGKKPQGFDYRLRGTSLHKIAGDGEFSGLPRMIPTRITLLPLDIDPVFKPRKYTRVGPLVASAREGKAWAPTSGSRTDMRNRRVNYVISKEGHIVQALPRRRHMFCEPSAMPFGVVVAGMGAADAMAINRWTPSIGESVSEMESSFAATVHASTASWPLLLAPKKPEPNRDAQGYMREFWFDATNPGPDGMTQAQFDAISRGDTVFVNNMNKRFKTGTIQDKDVVSVTDAGGNETQRFFWFKTREPVALFGERVVMMRFTSQKDRGTLVSPHKPFVVMPDGGAPRLGPKEKATAANLNFPDRALPLSKLSGGNHSNLVIGIATTDGTMTPEQVAAAGWLAGVVAELTAQHAGKASDKSKYATPQARGVRLKPTDLTEAADHIKAARWTAFKGGIEKVRQAMTRTQGIVWGDFNAWDDQLRQGWLSPIINDEIVGGDSDSSDPLPDVSSAGTSATAAEAAGAAATDAALASTVTQEVKDIVNLQRLDHYIKTYVGAIVNFKFFDMRFAAQQHAVEMAFNPYIMHGYPCLLLDDSDAKYHLVGYVHAVSHTFTPNSAATSATVTHLRNARWEKMLPYRKPQAQWFMHRLGKNNYDFSRADWREKLYADLEAAGLKLDPAKPSGRFAFLPVEMLDVREKTEEGDTQGHRPPPFVYHGGFGLDKKLQRDFSRYAEYLGYVNDAGKVERGVDPRTGGPLFENNFIFAGDELLNFDDGSGSAAPEEGSAASRALAAKEDIDTKAAYARIYRKIQKVGQLDSTRSQASLVAFVGEQSPHVPPENLVLYTSPPEDFNGEAEGAGVFKFDPEVRRRVRVHTEYARRHQAIRG